MKSSVIVESQNSSLTTSGPLGLAELMPMAYRGQDLSVLAQTLIDQASENDSDACYDLSILLQLVGDKATGLQFQNKALCQKREYRISPRNKRNKLRLLAFVTKGDLMTNTPLEFIAEGAGFELILYYVDTDTALPKVVPDHDVAIVALSELDRNRPCIALLEAWLISWPRPVLNPAENISQLSRDVICQTLQEYKYMSVPRTIRASRRYLSELACNKSTVLNGLSSEIELPLIIRPIDSHAGQGLARISCFADISRYLAEHAADTFFVSSFVDYRSNDGLFRKYRIVLINGKPRLVHMAISEHWMVHYLNAGMEDNASKRFEESQAMGSFERAFARKHKHAFSTLHKKVGLDYFGIDCAETKDGKLLIFEVGASLNVHSMDCEQKFPYKKFQINKIYADFLAMLENSIKCSRH